MQSDFGSVADTSLLSGMSDFSAVKACLGIHMGKIQQ
jgi:hypothetical protein